MIIIIVGCQNSKVDDKREDDFFLVEKLLDDDRRGICHETEIS